jgi:hypothetical protein
VCFKGLAKRLILVGIAIELTQRPHFQWHLRSRCQPAPQKPIPKQGASNLWLIGTFSEAGIFRVVIESYAFRSLCMFYDKLRFF